MKISLNWLQTFVDIDIMGLQPEDLARSLTMVGLAVDLVEPSGDDFVFDVDVTTNRPDCLNHLGVARELAAQYRLKLRAPDFTPPETDDSCTAEFPMSIEIEDPELCPRYSGRVLTGVRIGESPDWLKRRLEAVGQRPISNVVDITNYILFELGQPLHAFDYYKLERRRIVVRRARVGEGIRTLDGVGRELTESMLMICDGSRPVAVAGVMGGEDSEIGDGTDTILLESAYFDPGSIRQTSKSLGLSTEASYRFERGADPEMPVKALNLACRLIEEYCGSKCVGDVIDVNPLPYRPEEFTIRQKRVRQVLGIDVNLNDASEVLERLEFQPRRVEGDALVVKGPSFRRDIGVEDDLVEEIARHIGYERIPSSYPRPPQAGKAHETDGHDRLLEDTLVDMGFFQASNYAFSNPQREANFLGREPDLVALANPLTDLDTHLRSTLLPGLMESVRRNLNFGSRNIRLFEIGAVYRPSREADPGVVQVPMLALIALGDFLNPHWSRSVEKLDFFHVKGMVEALLERFDCPVVWMPASDVPFMHPGAAARLCSDSGDVLGVMGEFHPRLAEEFKLTDRAFYCELSLDALYQQPLATPHFESLARFQPVYRDLSFLLDKTVSFNKIDSQVQALKIPELKAFRLIDLYHGSGLPQSKVSLTVRLTFEAPGRTLTQAEIAERCDLAVAGLRESFAIEMR